MAPVVTLAPIEYFINVYGLIATFILIEALFTYFDLGRLRMVPTVSHLSDGVIFLAPIAPD